MSVKLVTNSTNKMVKEVKALATTMVHLGKNPFGCSKIMAITTKAMDKRGLRGTWFIENGAIWLMLGPNIATGKDKGLKLWVIKADAKKGEYKSIHQFEKTTMTSVGTLVSGADTKAAGYWEGVHADQVSLAGKKIRVWLVTTSTDASEATVNFMNRDDDNGEIKTIQIKELFAQLDAPLLINLYQQPAPIPTSFIQEQGQVLDLAAWSVSNPEDEDSDMDSLSSNEAEEAAARERAHTLNTMLTAIGLSTGSSAPFVAPVVAFLAKISSLDNTERNLFEFWTVTESFCEKAICDILYGGMLPLHLYDKKLLSTLSTIARSSDECGLPLFSSGARTAEGWLCAMLFMAVAVDKSKSGGRSRSLGSQPDEG